MGGLNVNSQPQGISSSIYYSGTVLAFDNGVDAFRFDLAMPSRAAGVWVGNVGNSNSDPVTPTFVRFFNAAGLVSEFALRQGDTGMIGSGANNRFFRGVYSDSPLTHIEVFNGANDFDGIIVDDVQWGRVAAPGDADLNAQVDFDDLLILARNYGVSGRTWSQGDFTHDGVVSFDDLLGLARNYGSAATLAADWTLAQSMVPEPTTTSVALLTIAYLGRRRARRTPQFQRVH